MKPKQSIALFDFDGTITHGDSLIYFLVYVKGYLKTFFLLFLESPILLGFLLKRVSRQATKEKVLTRFFKGMSLEEFRKKGSEFSKHQLYKYIKPEAKKRIEWHLRQSHRCILISASLETYLIPWAEELGFETTLASIPEMDSQEKITGKLKGLNCWGAEKINRLYSYLGPIDSFYVYAYGDSLGDKELLGIADEPFYKKMP